MASTTAPRTSLRGQISRMTDSNLLTAITIIVFILMYLFAIIFLQKGFLKPQTFFNILNNNAALIILSCGMSLLVEPEYIEQARRSIEEHHAAYHRIASLEGQIRPNRDRYC